MSEFENVLQECLLSLESDDANVEECLRRYPTYAAQLAPVLLTSLDLERGRAARPSAAFKARVRGRVIREMRAHPRRSVRSPFWITHLATSFAVLLLALMVAGTVYAQGVLPGNPFYGWKLASETMWRAVSPDPVATDLAIAQRRAGELLAIANNPELRAPLLAEYLEVVARLELELNAGNELRIRQVLDAQMEELNRSGIVLPELEGNTLPSLGEPTVVPAGTLPVLPELPQADPALPVPTISSDVVPEPTQSNGLPKVGSTASSVTVPEPAQASPAILPEVVPTLQTPSLLP